MICEANSTFFSVFFITNALASQSISLCYNSINFPLRKTFSFDFSHESIEIFGTISHSLISQGFDIILGYTENASFLLTSSSGCIHEPYDKTIDIVCKEGEILENNIKIKSCVNVKKVFLLIILFFFLIISSYYYREKHILKSIQNDASVKFGSSYKYYWPSAQNQLIQDCVKEKIIKSKINSADFKNNDYILNKTISVPSRNSYFNVEFDDIPFKTTIKDVNYSVKSRYITDELEKFTLIDTNIINSDIEEAQIHLKHDDFSIKIKPLSNSQKIPFGSSSLMDNYTLNVILYLVRHLLIVENEENFKYLLMRASDRLALDGVALYKIELGQFKKLYDFIPNPKVEEIMESFLKEITFSPFLNCIVNAQTINGYRVAGTVTCHSSVRFAFITASESSCSLMRHSETVFMSMFSFFVPTVYLQFSDNNPNKTKLLKLFHKLTRPFDIYQISIVNGHIYWGCKKDQERISEIFQLSKDPTMLQRNDFTKKYIEIDKKKQLIKQQQQSESQQEHDLEIKSPISKRNHHGNDHYSIHECNLIKCHFDEKIPVETCQIKTLTSSRNATLWNIGPFVTPSKVEENTFASIFHPVFFDNKGKIMAQNTQLLNFRTICEFQDYENANVLHSNSKFYALLRFNNLFSRTPSSSYLSSSNIPTFPKLTSVSSSSSRKSINSMNSMQFPTLSSNLQDGGALIEIAQRIEEPMLIEFESKSRFAVWVVSFVTLDVVMSVTNKLTAKKIEPRFSFLLENCHKDDIKMINESIDHIKIVSSISLFIEVRLKLYTDNYEWYQILLTRSNSSYLTMFATNIHEHKRRVSLFQEIDQQLLTAMRFGNVICFYFDDTHFPSRVYNSATTPYQAIDINWTTIQYNILSEAQEQLTEVFQNTLEGGPPFSVECPAIFSEFKWLTIRGAQMTTPGHLLGIMLDITQMKEAERCAIEAKQNAEEAMNAKSKFLLSMSHEIRTPLCGICSLIDMLITTKLNDEQTQMLQIVKMSFTRLNELLNDTLDLAKIEQNEMDVVNVKFEPQEILTNLIRPYFKAATANGVEMFSKASPRLPKMYYGSPHCLSRIFSNIVSNAVKFTSQAGANSVLSAQKESSLDDDEIDNNHNTNRSNENVAEKYLGNNARQEKAKRISISVKDDEEGHLIIKVKDTGIGISESDQQRIFEIFTQGDTLITRPYGGLGVGLALVKKMLDLINGKLYLKSEVGVGSSFKVIFPFEPLLVPYIPKTLLSMNCQILYLTEENISPQSFKSLKRLTDFYGFEIIQDVNKVDYNRIVLVTLSNYKKFRETSLKIKKTAKTNVILLHVSNEGVDDPEFYSIIKPFRLDFISTFLSHILWMNKRSINEQNDKSSPYELKDDNNKMVRFTELNDSLIQGNESSPDKKQKNMNIFFNLRVLVVDDDKTNQFIMKKILDKLKCYYTVANNGIEGISSLKDETFDIAFIDHQMPFMDGPTTTKNIRESKAVYADIPIIAMTASVLKEDEQTCLEAGMDFVLIKPVTLEKITEFITKGIEVGKKKRENEKI
ncbi:hypothetical protein TRFO_09454 [Tritrichomonas foetus]|uniref:ATPase n=1 Tax=Tritrichomonas foetus TaxID=1144522 RepID=A0A1J4JEB2_9EUKA|nr:hypothetical protein TRFO_09454 [Tritrichomonas foetus]|eukprot:OHS97448.1 hypothetical protein TRFO_09454 [Tritrichomonas foetus]